VNNLYQILAPRAGGGPQSERVGGGPGNPYNSTHALQSESSRSQRTAHRQGSGLPRPRGRNRPEGGMFAMGTAARSGTVWGRGARGEREIGPQRPQICPRSDFLEGGSRVSSGRWFAGRYAPPFPSPRLRRGVSSPDGGPLVRPPLLSRPCRSPLRPRLRRGLRSVGWSPVGAGLWGVGAQP
jgi:hypothetical protein